MMNGAQMVEVKVAGVLFGWVLCRMWSQLGLEKKQDTVVGCGFVFNSRFLLAVTEE